MENTNLTNSNNTSDHYNILFNWLYRLLLTSKEIYLDMSMFKLDMNVAIIK